MPRYIIIIIISFLFYFIKEDMSYGDDYCKKLSDKLGDNISITNKSNKYLIEYCPDNTCEIFTGKNIQKTCELSFLYLYSISDYAYLDDFKQDKQVEKEVKATYPGVDITSYLKELCQKYKISIFFTRSDEGHTIKQRVDLKKK